MSTGMLTKKQVADIFGVNFRTIDRWRHRRSFPKRIVLPSGLIRYLADDIERYRKKLCQKSRIA